MFGFLGLLESVLELLRILTLLSDKSIDLVNFGLDLELILTGVLTSLDFDVEIGHAMINTHA